MVSEPQSWLFTPADRPRALRSASGLKASARIVDLEDGTSQDRLETARDSLSDAVASLAPYQEVWVRLHGPSESPESTAMDLEAAVGPTLTGVLIPKVSEPADVQLVAEWLDAWEGATGDVHHPVQIGIMVETAAALEVLPQLASLRRVRRLFLGMQDLQAELGMREPSATAMYIRARVVVVSAAKGLGRPIESPWMNLADTDGLRRTARAARDRGFGGMLCVHPSQIDSIEAAFAPTHDEIRWARRVLRSRPSTEDATWLSNAQVIDAPVLLRAQAILDSSRQGAFSAQRGPREDD